MKQNTNSRKGRQAFYKTPEELQAAVDRYFRSIAGVPVYDKEGVPVLKRNGEQFRAGEIPPTLSGLARFCGYKNRETFTRQKNRSAAFADVVSVARLRIEEFYERALFDGDACDGAMFMLAMGFGWRKYNNIADSQPVKVNFINKAPKKEENLQKSKKDIPAHNLSIELLD